MKLFAKNILSSKMKIFPKIVNGLQPLTASTKSSILVVWQGSEYATENWLENCTKLPIFCRKYSFKCTVLIHFS